MYAMQNKYDLAQDLCKRCLSNDKSCSQAWEILGLVKEKDMDYEHAAECYEKVRRGRGRKRESTRFSIDLTYSSY
jgi:tetratricopeptide repeat protein 21B